MSYKPILFNTEMVKAIMDGRKTQTRRLLRKISAYSIKTDIPANKPPCKPGDILWVRETWTKMPHYVYKADDEHPEFWDYDDRWHPSIHMPKEAARIFLRVKDVRVERLREITSADAFAEGVECVRKTDGKCESYDRCPHENCCYPWQRFSEIWDTTIKPADLDKYGWDANPWVWVIEFESCEKPVDWR